jgi:hypothetical protein
MENLNPGFWTKDVLKRYLIDGKITASEKVHITCTKVWIS